MRGGSSCFRGKRLSLDSAEWPSRNTAHTVQSCRVGKLSSWLRDPGRPCVFWVITGFSILSAGRGHVVETGVLEPVPRWGPILFLLLRLLLSSSFSSHSLSVLPPLLCQLLCVFQLVQNQPAPSKEFTLSLPPFTPLLFHFLFFLSWPFLFLYHFNLTLQALPCLPHAPLYAAHIIGLAACLSKKIEGLFYIV